MRIAVIGPQSINKTFFAQLISEEMNLPLIKNHNFGMFEKTHAKNWNKMAYESHTHGLREQIADELYYGERFVSLGSVFDFLVSSAIHGFPLFEISANKADVEECVLGSNLFLEWLDNGGYEYIIFVPLEKINYNDFSINNVYSFVEKFGYDNLFTILKKKQIFNISCEQL